MYNHHF